MGRGTWRVVMLRHLREKQPIKEFFNEIQQGRPLCLTVSAWALFCKPGKYHYKAGLIISDGGGIWVLDLVLLPYWKGTWISKHDKSSSKNRWDYLKCNGTDKLWTDAHCASSSSSYYHNHSLPKEYCCLFAGGHHTLRSAGGAVWGERSLLCFEQSELDSFRWVN